MNCIRSNSLMVVVMLLVVGCAPPTAATTGAPSTGNPLPDNGNALVLLTDMPGEHGGTLSATTNGGERLSLVFTSQVGAFGLARGYNKDEWQRLMRGDELVLGSPPGSLESIFIVYEVRDGERIGRDASSERIRRVGDLFEWTIQFGQATGTELQPLVNEIQAAELTITFSPEFTCSTCIPGTEQPSGCITQWDPMFESDLCRNAIQDFDLVEFGFVDPAILE